MIAVVVLLRVLAGSSMTLRSGEGLTSFNKNSPNNSSREKSTMSFPGGILFRIREQIFVSEISSSKPKVFIV